MKRTIVMNLCVILTAFNFNGCCPKTPEPNVVYIPQKCKIPDVDKPIIDNDSYERSEDIVTKAIFNYMEMKKYAEKLLAAEEVCR